MKKFKMFTITALIFALMFSAVGCNGKDEKKVDNPKKEEDKVEEKIDLNGDPVTFVCNWELPDPNTEDGAKVWERKKKVEEKYNTKIVYETVAYDDLVPKFTQKSLSGEPIGDFVVLLNNWAFPSLVDKGFFQPLDEFIPKDDDRWPKNMRKVGSFDGKLYGISDYVGGATGFFYNKDMLKREGLEDPAELQKKGEWTWDKFLEICKGVTKDLNGDGKIDQYGLIGVPANLANLFIESNNGKITDISSGKPKLTVAEKNSMDAIKFLSDLYNVHKVVEPTPEGKWPDYNGSFEAGRVAFTHGEYWEGGQHKKNMTDAYGYVYVPKGPQATDYVVPNTNLSMWFVPKTAKHVKESIKVFEEWMEFGATEKSFIKSLENDHMVDKDSVDTAIEMSSKIGLCNYQAYPGLNEKFHEAINKISRGEEAPNTAIEKILPELQATIDAVMK
mgnify:FL=1